MGVKIPNYRRKRGAEFSTDMQYRYWLWRTWNDDAPVCAFIMLNPSTADHFELDPTCTRARNYAERWGYGTLIVGNIFAYRATDPDNMRSVERPVGPKNDEHLQAIVDAADLVVGAWGTHGEYQNRGLEVAGSLDVDWKCLSTTQPGHPNHPLYMSKDLEPTEWSVEELQ